MSAQPVSVIIEPLASRQSGGLRSTLRELRRSTGAAVGALMVALVVALALLAPMITPYPPDAIQLDERLLPPAFAGGSSEHLLGTDQLGRDIVARLLQGAQVSLLIATFVVVLASMLGVTLGLVAGYFGGWRDSVIMRLTDAWLAFPGLLLAIIVVTMAGPSAFTLIVILSLLLWMRFAKITRDIVLGLKAMPYVEATQTIGTPPLRVITRHLLPALISPLITLATLEFAAAVLAEAGLSYLGFGVQSPASSWGLMVAEGQVYLSTNSWLVVIPGLVIAGLVLSLNLLANWLRTMSDASSRDTRLRLPKVLGARTEIDLVDATRTGDVLLSVRDLEVRFMKPNGDSHAAISALDLEARRGETLGIVGESGSGKSVTVRAILGLLDAPGYVSRGTIRWTTLAPGRSTQETPIVVGDRVTTVFQNASASLNPLVPVGNQLIQVLRRTRRLTKAKATARAIELLTLVQIPSPHVRMKQYPFEFSGGMAQRLALALALAPEPDLIIADEPTTALDVTVQAQILQLLGELRDQFGLSLILVAHDLGIVAGTCDRVAVMYAGRVVEEGTVDEVFGSPKHHYTVRLIASSPRLDRPRGASLLAIPAAARQVQDVGANACSFAPRCTAATDICRSERPLLSLEEHRAACWHISTGARIEAEAVGHER
jgi:peptide/nickel transport system permease protein